MPRKKIRKYNVNTLNHIRLHLLSEKHIDLLTMMSKNIRHDTRHAWWWVDMIANDIEDVRCTYNTLILYMKSFQMNLIQTIRYICI
jgi:hypothetical protein